MGPFVEATELSKALIEAGQNLLKPYSSTDATLTLLDEIESLLAIVEQEPVASVYNALPSMKPLISADFLRNTDSDVRVSVVSCLTEIMRITAPEAPYDDDQMKEIFQVTVEAFGKLTDASCRSYKKAESVLETVSKVRSSLVMLDLECDDLVLDMFRQFLKIASSDHSQVVLLSMETIMITIIDESEEVPMDLLQILLTTVKKDSQDVSPTALKLVEKVLIRCSLKLQQCITEALKSTGTSLDMYSPIVSSICQSESATTQAHNVVNAKENENKLDLGLARKGNRSKRTAKGGTGRSYLKEISKQGQSESIDAETEEGSTMKRGRKPNSLMNPEEGYSFKTSSSNKEQSVVVSLPPSSKAKTGSRKRSQSKMEETSHDAGSIATSTTKKQNVKKDVPEEDDSMESKLETPEDVVMTQNNKTSVKKPPAVTKSVKTNGKKSVGSDAKKKNSEAVSVDMPITQSSKSKKKNSRAKTPLTKESDQTLKSHPKRKRSAVEEVESEKNEIGEDLVGKRVNIWWPLDKKFYEGVVDSYCSRKKMHRVIYSDGDAEELNLIKERWKLIEDSTSASKQDMEIDLPDSIPLSDLIRRKAKKKKSVTSSTKEEKRTKGVVEVVSNEPESIDGENLKSLKDMKAETGGTKGKTGKRQKATRAMDRESEKDADEKGEAETKGENSLKDENGSCKRDNQELSEDPNAELERNSAKELDVEPKTDGEECVAAKEPIAEPKSVGEEHKVAKEPTLGSKSNGEEHKSVKETNAEPETDEEGQQSLKEPNAEIETDGKEHKSVKKLDVEPKTDGEECVAAKEPIAEPKTDGEEHQVAKEPTLGSKNNGVEHKSVKETNAEPDPDEQEQKSLKERKAETETDRKQHKSVKELNAESETEIQEQESAKEPSESGKEENGTEEEDQKVTKEQTEEAESAVIQVDP